MILGEDASATAEAALHRVREPVRDPRVDDELAEAATSERRLHRGEHRPDETAAAMLGIDEHIEQGRAGARPSRPGDRESEEPPACEDARQDRASRNDLLPQLRSGEREGAPFGALELDHARPDDAPRPLAGRDQAGR